MTDVEPDFHTQSRQKPNDLIQNNFSDTETTKMSVNDKKQLNNHRNQVNKTDLGAIAEVEYIEELRGQTIISAPSIDTNGASVKLKNGLAPQVPKVN